MATFPLHRSTRPSQASSKATREAAVPLPATEPQHQQAHPAPADEKQCNETKTKSQLTNKEKMIEKIKTKLQNTSAKEFREMAKRGDKLRNDKLRQSAGAFKVKLK